MTRNPATSNAADVTAFDPSYAGPDRPLAASDRTIQVDRFDEAYRAVPPWDIGRPQPAFVELTTAGRITGRVLDVGCGTGELTLLLTGRGLEVLGLDASAPAIDQARVKAQARGLGARFMVGDALDLPSLGEALDTILDSGLLHILSDTDRARLVEGLHAVLRPGGVYDLLCFSEHASIPGPRRLTQAELRAAFGPGWQVEGIQGAHFEVLGDLPGADAWLATIRRRTSTSRSRRS